MRVETMKYVELDINHKLPCCTVTAFVFIINEECFQDDERKCSKVKVCLLLAHYMFVHYCSLFLFPKQSNVCMNVFPLCFQAAFGFRKLFSKSAFQRLKKPSAEKSSIPVKSQSCVVSFFCQDQLSHYDQNASRMEYYSHTETTAFSGFI